MILKNNKQNAFTIVELLIVIVVIGILAAISIVSYNGIQNRARDTSVKNAASQVRTKIEAYNSIEGSYPAADDVRSGLDVASAPEARIDGEVTQMIVASGGDLAGSHSADSVNTIAIEPCGTAPSFTGYQIEYYQSGTNGDIEIGTC